VHVWAELLEIKVIVLYCYYFAQSYFAFIVYTFYSLYVCAIVHFG